MFSVKIYGKADCPWCDRAKRICEDYNIPYDYTTLNALDAAAFLHETVSPNVRTVPAVVVDGIWIGGYEELRTLINENYTINEGEVKHVLKG